jgi:hypothetical protein
MGTVAAMTEDRYTNAEMAQLCPDLTAKTVLVLVTNPVTTAQRIYARDGKDWVCLQGEEDLTGGAAQESSPPPDAAPLSGEGPGERAGGGDDVSARPPGPGARLPHERPGAN